MEGAPSLCTVGRFSHAKGMDRAVRLAARLVAMGMEKLRCSLTASGETMFCISTSLSSSSGKRDRKPLPACGEMAVSYTHLDVYKRQTPNGRAARVSNGRGDSRKKPGLRASREAET